MGIREKDKKQSFRSILILLSFVFISFAESKSQNKVSLDWDLDIDFLVKHIKKEHYVFSKKKLPAQFYSDLDKLKKNIKKYSNERILIELEKLMVFLGDGHSYILPFSAKKFDSYFLPIEFYWFNDGFFIVNAEKPFLDLIGSQILYLNHLPIKIFFNQAANFVHHDNNMTIKWLLPSFLRFRGVYEMFDLPAGSDSLVITYINQTEKCVEIKIPFVKSHDLKRVPKLTHPVTVSNGDTLLYLMNIETNYWFKQIENKTVYCQFNKVRNEINESLDDFSTRLAKYLNDNKITNLIIDVRHNNGGNKDILAKFLNNIIAFSKKEQNKLFVITGRNTFSAAQVFISLLYRDGICVFLGEHSSSKPNFVGEENILVLPESGAIVSISNRYHETISGNNLNYIPLNYSIPLKSENYFNNTDPVMDFILKEFKYESENQ